MRNVINTIGIVSEYNPFIDKTAWSGLIYKIRESIEKAGYDVVWVNCRINGKIGKFFTLLLKFFHGKDIMFGNTNIYYRLMCLSIDKSIMEKCDLLFFPGGASVLKFLSTKIPAIYYSDSTFQIMYGYYWPKEKITTWQYKIANSLEREGILRSRINIRASHWAATSVYIDYGFEPSHTYMLRFGANLDEKDMLPVKSFDGNGTLNILFSGVDWERKGAAIAIETVKILNSLGIKSQLTIVGIKRLPEEYLNCDFINFVGYLNKTISEQYSLYLNTIRQCHILLLPTRAECAGVVFCEASAFGMPIYTYKTGGIPDYVFDDKNGYMLDISANAKDFANLIANTISPTTQKKLSLSCRKVYEEKLNWNTWAVEFKKIIDTEF